MEILFSLQIFTTNQKIRGGVISFTSQRNFKQTFEFLLKNRMSVSCGDSNIEEGDQ